MMKDGCEQTTWGLELSVQGSQGHLHRDVSRCRPLTFIQLDCGNKLPEVLLPAVPRGSPFNLASRADGGTDVAGNVILGRLPPKAGEQEPFAFLWLT
ncbi:hypothetical protein GN956_G24165 [Arapaima gigas]